MENLRTSLTSVAENPGSEVSITLHFDVFVSASTADGCKIFIALNLTLHTIKYSVKKGRTSTSGVIGCKPETSLLVIAGLK